MLARPAPQAQLPLIGRHADLEVVLHQRVQAARGLVRVVLVGGEPGIGKSRLLDALAARAAEAGATVLRGGSSDAAGMPPYLPFLEALGEHVLATDAATLYAQAGPLAPVLATILPELALRLGELPSSYVLPPEQARLRLFEAVDGFLAAIAGDRLLVVLLDDLQWADPAALDLLCHIARRHRPGSPLLIVGAFRADELELNPALQRAVAELNRLRVSTRVALQRLGADEVAAMAAAYLGGPLAPAAIQPLFAHSEGNPFFVEELLLGWLERGVLVRRNGPDGGALYDLTPSVALPLPTSIVAAVRQRLARLAPPVAELLRVAAVIGRTFDAERVAVVAGRDAENVDECFGEAARAQLIRPLDAGAYTFSHDKIRESLSQDLTPSRLRRLHGAIGRALEADAERSGARQLAELAFHFARAGDAGRGVRYAIGAAEDAMRSYAPAEAAAHLRAALGLLPAGDARRGGLQARLTVTTPSSRPFVASRSGRDMPVTTPALRAGGVRRAWWRAR